MIVPRHMKLVLSMHASFIISPTRPKKEGLLSLFGRQVSPNIAGVPSEIQVLLCFV